jgi:ABC transporter transmembrane region 2
MQASFSVILYKIYPDLFVAIFAYAGAGTAIAYALGQPLVGLNLNQLQKEADFRYSLIRVRENSESIGKLLFVVSTDSTVLLFNGALSSVLYISAFAGSAHEAVHRVTVFMFSLHIMEVAADFIRR